MSEMTSKSQGIASVDGGGGIAVDVGLMSIDVDRCRSVPIGADVVMSP
jgi:hypothetical protein